MRVSEDIVPMAEFKSNASRLIRHMRETHRPIIVTHNGRPAAVVITPEEYDRFNDEQMRLFLLARYNAVVAAEAPGELIEDEDMWRQMEEEFGPIPAADDLA